MNKKKVVWIAVAVLGVLILGAAGFVGYRIYNRSQAGFPGGPARGFGNRFSERGDRSFGEVIFVGDASLTIVNQDGEQLSFSISSDTQFFSQDSSLNGLQDLEVGMEITVLYESRSDDELSALSIGTGQGPQRPRGDQNN